MSAEVVDVKWFSGRRTCGFILILDPYLGYKCYLGPWPYTNGSQHVTPEMAIKEIRNYGAKVPFDLAYAVFKDSMLGNPVKYDGLDTDIVSVDKDVRTYS